MKFVESAKDSLWIIDATRTVLESDEKKLLRICPKRKIEKIIIQKRIILFLIFAISNLLSQNQFIAEPVHAIIKVSPHMPVMDVNCIKARLSCVCAIEPQEPAYPFDVETAYSAISDAMGKTNVAVNPFILFDNHLSRKYGNIINVLPEMMII